MTHGTVLVLGTNGVNFGAGMTGGVAYVLDLLGDFERRYNPDLVAICRLGSAEDTRFLQSLIHRHLEMTNSARAQEILMSWIEYEPLFWKVTPRQSSSVLIQAPQKSAESLAQQRA
jgi:glutamate synthase domain-containing protein 3